MARNVEEGELETPIFSECVTAKAAVFLTQC